MRRRTNTKNVALCACAFVHRITQNEATYNYVARAGCVWSGCCGQPQIPVSYRRKYTVVRCVNCAWPWHFACRRRPSTCARGPIIFAGRLSRAASTDAVNDASVCSGRLHHVRDESHTRHRDSASDPARQGRPAECVTRLFIFTTLIYSREHFHCWFIAHCSAADGGGWWMVVVLVLLRRLRCSVWVRVHASGRTDAHRTNTTAHQACMLRNILLDY